MKNTHIRQAIETKYLPPTNTLGARYKAVCDRGSLVVSQNYELNAQENHVAAAEALIAQFVAEDAEHYQSKPESNPWTRPFVSGGLSSGIVAHVFIEREGEK